MTRVVDGKVEVYFHQHNSSSRRPDMELVFSLEHFLLLANESTDLTGLRLKLYDEAKRVTLPKAMAVGR